LRRAGTRARAALLVLAPLLSPGAWAQDDAADTRARLEALEGAIGRLAEAQRRDQERRGEAVERLRDTEEAIGRLTRGLRDIEARIDAARRSIADLDRRRASLRAEAEAQTEAVRLEVRRAYQAGDGDQLRLLLGEENPQRIARLLAYYRLIIAARRDLIDGFRETLESLESVEAQLEAQRRQLGDEERNQRQQIASLEAAREERLALVAELDARIATQTSAIAEQEEERARLEALLEEIEAAAARLTPDMEGEPFTAARGRMPWPVEGRISSAFGRPRAQGKLRWQGVRMRAEAGSPVNAIHHGRVVYADWLRGSGLLLVIDHGEGFMSLYAHNESLLRDVGDYVTAGAAVATVGDTGGQSEAGLYFEIRKDGKPMDPAGWCR
jgi:septal ring factor EnvC (AmiA/AmiB activator)